MEIEDLIKRGALWNLLGFISKFVIGLLSSILFVRLLGQEQYGIVTFILSCVFFSGMLVNLGFGTVMSKSIAEWRALNEEAPLISMLKKITGFRLLVFGGLVIIFSLDGPFHLIGKPYLKPYLYLVPLLVFTSYFQGTFRTLLTSYYEQGYLNLTSILEMLIKLVLVLISISLGWEIAGFLMAIFLSQLINAVQLTLRSVQKVFSKLSQKKTVFHLKEHTSLAFNAFLVTISIRLLGRESDLLLLGILHPDIKHVAIYAVIFGFPKMVFDVFGQMLGGGLGLTAFTEQIKKGELRKVSKNYENILHLFSVLLFPIIVGSIIVGNGLVTLMYGVEYSGIQWSLSILFVSLGLGTFSPIASDILYALEKEKWIMRVQIGFGVLNIIANILVIPTYGAYGVAVTTGASVALMTMVELFLVHQLLHPKYPLKYLIRYLLMALFMGELAYQLPFADGWKVLLGIVVYSILLLIHECFIENGEHIKWLKHLRLS